MTAPYQLRGKRVFVAGHRGMVGSALIRRLADEDCTVLTAPRDRVDLRDAAAVRGWFESERPQAVFLAAARVGGIRANDEFPADFLYDNLAIQTAVIEAAFRTGVEKLLFLGSSCIYPKLAPQPIAEESLLTGPLEPTNQWYAVAKIAGLKMCQAYRRQHGADFISAMPTNLYGPGDNFDLERSHVVPALIRRTEEARRSGAPSLTLWGTGSPRREFLHVDDAADALVHLMKSYSDEGHVNVGCGDDLTILALAGLVAELAGYGGRLTTDPSRPDGTPRKLLDVGRLFATGWRPRIDLRSGLRTTIDWYRQNAGAERLRLGAA